MKTIHKYQVDNIVGQTYISMPRGAEIVKFGHQNDRFCVWAIVDPDAEHESRAFEVVGTGYEIDPKLHYIDTVFVGVFVWHLFEWV